MFAQVIFSIDNGHNLRTRKKFLKWVDNLIATEKVAYCSPCIGYWEGYLECSYMVRAHEFMRYIKDSGWVDNQTCFLHVPGEVRQPCTLIYQDNSRSVLGTMCEVEKKELHKYNAWTYVEETGKYYVA